MILKYIRTAYLHRLILPGLLLLTVLWVSSFLPWGLWLFPEILEPQIPLQSEAQEDNIFYRVSPGQLYYTGCDSLVGDRVNGHYYYAIDGRGCQVYLLPASGGSPEPILSPGAITGTLKEDQELLYEITDAMSVSLDWSQRHILEMTGTFIFDAVSGAGPLNRLLYLLIPVCILASTVGFLYSLYIVLFPARHSSLRRVRRETGRTDILRELEEELSARLLDQTSSLCLTDHYLINLQDGNFQFQPLDQICWIYIHTSFTGLLRRHYKGKFYFTWWTRTGKNHEVPLPYKDDGVDIMETIQEHYPAVLIRYSQENKNAAEKILKKKIFGV